jgi:hypothetical protein
LQATWATLRIDVYAQQRGREQVVHELYNAPLDKIRPIRENRPKLQNYLDAAMEIEL